jgi:hemolysin D
MNMMSRQLTVVRSALAEDRARVSSLVRIEESDFLPAALEITEKPVSPTARATGWVLMIGLAFTIPWMIFSKVDIVASAQGKLAPSGSVKLVQPAEPGVVRSILVEDGQRVVAGQPLVELDPTETTASVEQARKAWETAALDVARLRAVVSALDGRGLVFATPTGIAPELANTQYQLARAQLTEIQASSSGYSAEIRAAEAARAQAAGEARKLDETLPLMNQQLQANEALAEKGYVSKLRVIEMRRQQLAVARDRDIAVSSSSRAGAQLASAGSGAAVSRAQARARILTDLLRAESEEKLRREELVKGEQRVQFRQLTAPVSGTVAQLAVHTIGGVVEAAKPVMIVVPDGDTLVADVLIPNRDVGYLRKGQTVAIKLDAFPFTRHGTVPGKIETIASDAVEDDKIGPAYRVRVKLMRSYVTRDGEKINLTPGLSATADIQTGKRSIMSYLISPIDKATNEAARER